MKLWQVHELGEPAEAMRLVEASSPTAGPGEVVLEKLGITPTYGDHEDSPGQLELNFLFDRAIRTADNLSTYRQICAAVARKHDVVATFMPKPFTGVSANGAHHHFTLVDEAVLRPRDLHLPALTGAARAAATCGPC